MRELCYKGYRIRYQRTKQWFAEVYPPNVTVAWETTPTATLEEGPDVLIAIVRALIDEDIETSKPIFGG